MKHKRHSKAFSLLEVSSVLIIIGVLIAGVFAANGMLTKFRITAAQNLTQSSPISAIPDAAVWLETSLETSFNPTEANNGNSLTAWNDQRNTANKVTITPVGGGPIYSNTINRVHAVEFKSSVGYLKFDGSFLNNSYYTIFLLEKRKAAGSNYFMRSTDGSNANDDKLNLGYSADSIVTYKQGSDTSTAAVSSYVASTDKPRIFVFVSDATGKKTYINGVLASQSSDTTQLTNVGEISIGKGYTGEIGEIAIFARGLKADERKSIEDYVGKKWTAKVNGTATPTCLIGAVTDSGCDLSLASCSISTTGVSTTSVGPAPTSAPLSCDATRYAGTVSYTCIDGTANVTGTCACATGYTGAGCTSCAANYSSDGNGNCIPSAPCATTSVAGVSSPASVTHGTSGSLTCNAANFTGTVSYNCDNGNLNASGSCQGSCAINSTTGITSGTVVLQGSTSQSCNVANYTGTVNYTCGSAGAFAVTSGSCVCATGYTGAGCTSCAVGYSMVAGTCQQSCTITAGITGVTSGATVSAASVSSPGTINCNGTNFDTTDSINYTCIGGTFAVSGAAACDSCAVGYQLSGTTCILPPLICTGGTITCTAGSTPTCTGGNVVHTFNSSGSLTCTSGSTNTLATLFVAGGGSGGKHSPAGGGAGGQVIALSGKYIANGDVISVTIGSGGAVQNTSDANGNRGGDTIVTFSTTSSATSASGSRLAASTTAGGGGGGGGSYTVAPDNGTAPGGGACSSCSGKWATGTNRGGGVHETAAPCGNTGAGGGGSTANVGGTYATAITACAGGKGADGTTSTISGTSKVYGGGGGGAARYYPSGTQAQQIGGAGGTGGGGIGVDGWDSAVGGSGTANLGGGGGGGRSMNGGAGGSGVVIFSYPGR